MPTSDGKIVCLALDGGGVRGIITLEVLKYIENRLGKPLSGAIDLCAGSSTGSLIGSALMRKHGMTADETSAAYLDRAPKIFSRSILQKLQSLATLNGPKYNNSALYSAMIDILGGNTKLSDVSTNLLTVSYDLLERTPRFMTSWGTPDITMVSACMRSSAAPTYFMPFEGHVDAGTVNNAPCLTAVIEACRLYQCTVRDVLCLSIGTGSDQQPIDPDAAKGWGLLSWAQPLLSIFMDGSSTLATYQMQRLLPDANVLRLQCDVRGDMSEMDNTSPQNLANLQKAGKALVATHQKQIDAFLEQLI